MHCMQGLMGRGKGTMIKVILYYNYRCTYVEIILNNQLDRVRSFYRPPLCTKKAEIACVHATSHYIVFELSAANYWYMKVKM